MKKFFALLLCLMMACFAAVAEEAAPDAVTEAAAPDAVTEEAAPERTVAPYEYALEAEEFKTFDNMIFNADVIISGDMAQIVFTNCEFNGNIILTSSEATRVLLLGCDVKGECVIQNETRWGGVDYNNPKFLTDTPVTAVCEDCVGSVIAMSDFEIVFNGQTYTMADAQYFNDAATNDLVPYDGQEATYFSVARWDEKHDLLTAVIAISE